MRYRLFTISGGNLTVDDPNSTIHAAYPFLPMAPLLILQH